MVAIVGEAVKLQRRGRSYVGLCPFHKEKSPSFHVNDERGFYHCFGCGVSGDVFRFVQETQGLSFIEAVRALAERAGVEIVEQASEPERRQLAEARRRQQELYDVGNAAASFFESMLRENPLRGYAEAELARRALVTDSPTSEIAQALQAFRVGYAPYGWDGLASHLKKAGLSLQAAEKVGLVMPRRSGSGYYDRFRHRLMFAVLDVQGRVIAFSGRALEEPDGAALARAGLPALGASDGPPAKYINSPESPIYRKREAVFGLFQARDSIRQQETAVLVEGNFDVVSLHARGIKNVVAPLGTAFTVEQARQLKRFAPNVVLLFDGDNAGRRAAAAAREPCREAALNARVAPLPNGTDPDELIRTAGVETLSRIVRNASGLLEYLIDQALSTTFNAADVRAQAVRIKAVTELLASEDDPTVRALATRHADHIAERLGIADATTFAALGRIVEQALAPKAATAENRPKGPSLEPPARARSRDRRGELTLEIFGAILDYPELLDTPEVQDGVQLLEGELAVAIVTLRQNRDAVQLCPEQVLAKLAPSIHPFAAARLAAPRHVKVEDARTELLGNVDKLKRLELKRQRSAVVEDLERAAKAGDFEQEMLLLREHMRRARERHGLGER